MNKEQTARLKELAVAYKISPNAKLRASITDLLAAEYKPEAEALVKLYEGEVNPTTRGNYAKYLEAITQDGMTGLFRHGFVAALAIAGAGAGLGDACRFVDNR